MGLLSVFIIKVTTWSSNLRAIEEDGAEIAESNSFKAVHTANHFKAYFLMHIFVAEDVESGVT